MERNERFGLAILTPVSVIPEEGEYLYEIYFSVSARCRRIVEGVCGPISPGEFAAWSALTHTIVYPVEYGILAAMDDAFCEETNIELEAYRERLKEQSKA